METRQFALVVVVACMSFPAIAQDATGVVTISPPDPAGADAPAAAVGFPLKVQGPDGETVVYTDQNGQWSLYNLKEGTYSVEPLAPVGGEEGAVTTFDVKDAGFFQKILGRNVPSVNVGDIQLDAKNYSPSNKVFMEK